MKELRKSIKIVAKDENISEIEAITLIQTGAAKIGDEAMLEALCEIKSELIEAMF